MKIDLKGAVVRNGETRNDFVFHNNAWFAPPTLLIRHVLTSYSCILIEGEIFDSLSFFFQQVCFLFQQLLIASVPHTVSSGTVYRYYIEETCPPLSAWIFHFYIFISARSVFIAILLLTRIVSYDMYKVFVLLTSVFLVNCTNWIVFGKSGRGGIL